MEEDILSLMEALTIQASDADPDPVAATSVGVAPAIQTLPLEDALSTACHGVNLGQKTEHQEETRDRFNFSPCLSATDPGLCTNVALEVSPGTHDGGNVGKKRSRKRRNKMKRKVYLSWPVTLETRESSTRQASVMEASFRKEPRRKGEKEKAVVPAQLWPKPASTWLPEASPVQPSLEEISVAARKKRKAQKRRHCRKRAKKNQKIESSPWPVTVQAWASFVNPELVQTSFTDFSPAAAAATAAGIEDDMSVFSLSKGTQTNIPGSPAPLLQAFWEEVAPDVNAKRKIKKKKHKGWQGKKDNALDHTWPLEIQAWAPFQAAAAPVQALSEDMSLQRECWPPLKSEKERECFLPWSEGTEEGSFSAIAPLQISLKEVPAMTFGQSKTEEAKRRPDTREEQFQGSEVLALESYQSWGNAEQYQGHQDKDDWDYSILDMLTQAECYCGDPFSEEGDKAPPVTGSDAYTSISEAETDRQEAEEDKGTFQTLCMGKWGGF
ncbi:uncharacterized protein LOC131899508 [Peromyscus eremicus]|uniref:uncharacterized protein LOC131899508 n=1 Tax=Peromyscus eremicus TaxID=42410 RepID=UPI0027DDAA4C|nr:uncharacterized protein LOC131899508 [Peromyscus eremicus]